METIDLIVALASFYEEVEDLQETYEECEIENPDINSLLEQLNNKIITQISSLATKLPKTKKKKKKNKKNKNKNNN